MKKIKILTLLLLIAVFSLNAQTPEVTVGRNTSPIGKMQKRVAYTKLAHVDANEIITSEYKAFDKVFTVYDFQSMNMTETFILKADKINGKSVSKTKHIFHSDKITTFFSFYDNTTNTNTIYGKIIDRQDNNIVKPTKLMKISAKTKNKLGQIDTYQSPDKSKIMYLRKDDYVMVEQGEVINIGVFDLNLNKLIDKELKFPKKYEKVVIKQILLTNEGKVSIVVNVNYNKLFVDGTKNNYGNYKIFVLDKDQEDFVEISGLETDKFLSNCKGFVSNDSSHLITYCGMYNKGSNIPNDKTKTIDGFYTITLNTKNWEIKSLYYNELNDKLQKKFINLNQKYSGNQDKDFENSKDIRNLFMNSVVYNPNGSMTIYCEFESYRVTTGSSSTLSSSMVFYSQIIVLEIDNTGKLTNSVIIPKAQAMSLELNLGSYIVINSGEKKHLLYNDTKLNDNSNNSPTINIFFNFKHSTLRYATIDNKGKITKEALDKGGKSVPVIRTNDYYIVNGNTIITLGYVIEHKELSLVKIEY